MIKHINFNSNPIDRFILEVKNIIDNDFALKSNVINISGVSLVFDYIFDSKTLKHRVILLNDGIYTSSISNDVFYLYDYVIDYVPYCSLYIIFNLK